MTGSVYDTPAAPSDLVAFANGPAAVPSPRGLLSVASVVDVNGPARWGVNAALYEHFVDFPATPGVGHGVEKMDPDERCPSPPVGEATELAYGRASAYQAWSRIACIGVESDASAYVRAQFAAREQVLMESILAAIVAEAPNIDVGVWTTDGFAAAERAFSLLHTGQGTVWMSYETLYKASDAGVIVEQGNALYTYTGNRVATSPVFTQDLAITPNLTVQREADIEVLDFYERHTGLADALAQRLYLYLIDPATDVVAATFA